MDPLQVPCGGPSSSLMRRTLRKVHATDLTQGPCDGLYEGPIRRTSHSIQVCIDNAKKLTLDGFAQAPSDGPFASPMRWTFCKAHVTDFTQGPCDGLYVGPIL
eukprot:3996681-Pleurochrysis_carterae.AAC.1